MFSIFREDLELELEKDILNAKSVKEFENIIYSRDRSYIKKLYAHANDSSVFYKAKQFTKTQINSILEKRCNDSTVDRSLSAYLFPNKRKTTFGNVLTVAGWIAVLSLMLQFGYLLYIRFYPTTIRIK